MRRFFFAPDSSTAATTRFNADGNEDKENPSIASPSLQQLASGQILTLPDTVYHHWCRVLRAQVGEQGIFFDGLGGEATVVLDTLDKKTATAKLVSFVKVDRTAPTYTTIALVMSRGDRMDYAIQKATELGATAIQLLTSQHGEVRLKPQQVAKKQAHWQQVAVSACEQCGLNRPPLIFSPVAIDAYLGSGAHGQVEASVQHLLSNDFYQAYQQATPLRLVLAAPSVDVTANDHIGANHSVNTAKAQANFDNPSFDNPSQAIVQHRQRARAGVEATSLDAARPYRHLARFDMLIGAEGGLSYAELRLAQQQGFNPWCLGSRILRTETAPVVALTLINLIDTCT